MAKIYDYQGNVLLDGAGRGGAFITKGIAHRGVNYSTSTSSPIVVNNADGGPENTLPAYIIAAKKGFRYVECDVSFTSDSVPVLLHDNTINRTSNGTGTITSLTLAQVRSYDFGYLNVGNTTFKIPGFDNTPIPTLEEFLVLCKNLSLHPYIELKGAGGYTQAQIESVVDLVYECGMKGNVTFISFESTFLTYVKNYDDEARLAFVVYDLSSSPAPGLTQASINTAKALLTGKNEVVMDSRVMSDAACELCIQNDIPLETWGTAVVANDTEANILALNPYITGVTSNKYDAGAVLYNNAIGE